MFQTISSTLYEVGRAIRKELFSKIVGNLDDLNSRATILEAGASKVVIWDDRVVLPVNSASFTGLDLWKSPSAFNLLDAKVAIQTVAGITGILEMDVLKSPDLDPANFNSVFTTKPSIDYSGASDYDESTNAVFDITQQSVAQGDWLRLDISQIPSNINGFAVFLIGEFN